MIPSAGRTPWIPLYEGIDHATGVASNAFDLDGVPRIQIAKLFRIDLQNPDVSFTTTPASGIYQTTGQTISGFLSDNPAVKLAINANFSWVEGGFAVGSPYALLGLAVSAGLVVCDPTKPAKQPQPTDAPDVRDAEDAGAIALVLTEANQGRFAVVTASTPPAELEGVWTAVAGSTPPVSGGFPPQKRDAGPLWLVQASVNRVDPDSAANCVVAARTAVGLGQEGRYLYLAVVEGRENATPPYGAGLHDIAQWLMIAGADEGINLDGGGSSVAALSAPDGPVLLNIPYGDEATPGKQRAVGNFFGVIANPLPS